MVTVNYLTDPRKNRNSGARKKTPLNEYKIQTVESKDIRTKEYLGKSYIVYGTILKSVDGELLRYETEWEVID